MKSDKGHSWRRRGNQSRRGERGTALVEAAFVTPLFLILIFGIMEFGFLFRNYLTVANTTREGSRTASVSGSSPEADYLTLRSVEHAFAAWGVENLDFVVIYHATGPNDTIPPGCKVGPVPNKCNYFTPAEFLLSLNDAADNPTDYFRCVPAIAVDRHWCPADRNTGLSDPAAGGYGSGPAYIGVYVQAEHHYVTGFFGSTGTLSDDRIIRIEPDKG